MKIKTRFVTATFEKRLPRKLKKKLKKYLFEFIRNLDEYVHIVDFSKYEIPEETRIIRGRSVLEDLLKAEALSNENGEIAAENEKAV